MLLTVFILLFDSCYLTGDFCDFDTLDSWYQKSSGFKKKNAKSLNSTNGPVKDVTKGNKRGK